MITEKQAADLNDMIDDVVFHAMDEECAIHRGYSHEQDDAEKEHRESRRILNEFIKSITEVVE